MERERCKITLDSPENIYFAGQQIKGEICINLTKKTKIRGICFKIQGYGKCSWYELLRRDSQNPIYPKTYQRSIIYSSNESYLQHESYIIGSKSARPIELEAGSHTYQFSYQLQTNLPSSFIGNYGCIKYKMKFIIEKAWNFDDKYSVPITIIKYQPLCIYNLSATSVLRQMTKNIGVFTGGPISLVAELPRSEVVRDGKLILRVTVDNKSNTHVDKLKFSIRQSVKYFSQQPLCIQRDEIFKLYKKETGGVQKKSERTFEHELQVPACQPTDHSCSQIISILYNVQVDVILPGLYKNITVILPFEICSHEINTPVPPPLSIGQQQQQGSGGVQAIGIGWNMYPAHNTSITSFTSLDRSISSPSHSVDNYSLPSNDTSTSPEIGRSFISSASIGYSGITSTTAYLRRDASNRSSVSSMYSQVLPTISTQSPSTSFTTPPNYRYPSEQPPSYDELFGNSPGLSDSVGGVPSAPPLDVMQK